MTNKRKVIMNDSARKEVARRKFVNKMNRYVADRVIDDLDRKLAGRKRTASM